MFKMLIIFFFFLNSVCKHGDFQAPSKPWLYIRLFSRAVEKVGTAVYGLLYSSRGSKEGSKD